MPLSKPQIAELLEEARRNREKAEDETRQNDEEAHEDLKFVAGEQWHNADMEERKTDGRPFLTINQMPQFIRQVTGDIRLNSPSIKVRPVDSGADVNLAKTLTGLIRNIEYQSRAMQAYINAAESAARCGIGHFRIVTEFSGDDTFEQDIRIDRITNPFAVKWDPYAEKHDRSDANWVFVLSEVDRDAFKAQYPGASDSGFDHETQDYDTTLWRTRDSVTVAEYWRKEKVTRTIAQMEAGEVIDITDWKRSDIDRAPVVRTRDVNSHRVMQYLITDSEVLEGPFEWMGRDFPIIPVLGEEIHIGERVVRHGIIRFAKDSQRQYNYWQTNATETMALAPKSPYIATQQQIEGHETQWQEANRKNYSVLIYTPDPNVPGAPQRNPPPDLPVAAVNLMQLSGQDMHKTTGIYPSSLGASGNETSGRAISLRQTEGDVGTYVYIQNLAYAIEQAGRILIDIIPKIYDSERIVRVLGEDDKESVVTLNQPGVDEKGEEILINDITIGRYDVVVTTGPSFSTKRMEAADSMMQFIQAYPQAATLAGDLIAKAMDWPGAELIAERLEQAMQPSPPDPKAQADAAKSMADAKKKEAEAEGQQLENMIQQLNIAATTGILQQILAPIVQEQLTIALGNPQGSLTPMAQ